MYTYRWVVTGLLALLVIPQTLPAQATGTLMGTVTAAESGGPLAGAQVSVQGTVRRTVTDAEGRYRITIEPGTYTVQVSTLGRQAGSRQVSATAGGTATVNFSLGTSAVAIEGITAGNMIKDSLKTKKPAAVKPGAAAKPAPTKPKAKPKHN